MGHNRQLSRKNKFLFDRRICAYEGIIKPRPGWAVGDGYAVGDDPFDEKRKSEDTESTESVYSSYSPSSARAMDRDRYEPSQYGERGYAAADGYERDARSDYYEQSQYGGNQRAYLRDPPAYAPAYQYSGSRNRDQRRSYDDQDLDYVEKTRITKYRREPVTDRGLMPYRAGGEVDQQRARSQVDYRREDRDGGRRERERGRRDSSSSSSDREGHNTPLKKWAATFAGAAAGGVAAQQITSRNSRGGDTNWVLTAIGAVVGGLLGREVEKKVYEHKDKRERDREDRW